MTITLNARMLICDYIRRGLVPDKKISVNRGNTLELWLVNNEFAALVRLPDGKTTIRGEYLYINTYEAQDIADHVLKHCWEHATTLGANASPKANKRTPEVNKKDH